MEESKIDSIRFGFKVGKTDGKIFRNISFEEIKKEGYKLIIARVNLNDLELINEMEAIGFRIKDVQITYRHNLSALNTFHFLYQNSSITIREFKNIIILSFYNLLLKSFSDSGFKFYLPKFTIFNDTKTIE